MHVLADLYITRRQPDYLCPDNSSEFTAKAIRKWLKDIGVNASFVEPGCPWVNGYSESFNGKLRDELLNGEIFCSLKEAQVVIEKWRQDYNAVRPHSSLRFKPPAPVILTTIESLSVGESFNLSSQKRCFPSSLC